jgi:hypothetical protein
MSARVRVSFDLDFDEEPDARGMQRIENSLRAILRLGNNSYANLIVRKERANDFAHGGHDQPMFHPGGHIPTPKKEQDHGTA